MDASERALRRARYSDSAASVARDLLENMAKAPDRPNPIGNCGATGRTSHRCLGGPVEALTPLQSCPATRQPPPRLMVLRAVMCRVQLPDRHLFVQ